MPRQRVGQFWLWVTRPEWYLDEYGNERPDLEPGYGPTDDWWTCGPETFDGDLAFLWRTSPKSDIGYLIRVKGEAFPVPEGWKTAHPEQTHRCYYEVLYRFGVPIRIRDLRGQPGLQSWIALRCNFQKTTFPIPIAVWNTLNRLMIAKSPDYQGLVRNLGIRGPAIEDSSARLPINKGKRRSLAK